MVSPNSNPFVIFAIAFCAVVFSTHALVAQETEGQWYKGNLHTHSLWSDGDDFPDMIVRWYVQHDYNFLALTDHNILSQGERWMSAAAIEKRGGEDAIEKYLAAMENVVEIRENEKGKREIRLRTYAECKKQFEKSGSFLLMQGEEISDAVDGAPLHMNATNLSELLTPTGGASMREAMRANLRAAKLQANRLKREILVHLNHPNFGWAVSAADLAAVTEERFFEVYNAHPGVNHHGNDDHPSVEKIWDIANTIRTSRLGAPPLLGLATDDCHYYHGRKGSQPGRGWIMVQSQELTPDSILKSINAGSFYASSGIELKSISFDSSAGIVRIEIAAEKGIEYETQLIGTLKNYDSPKDVATGNDGDLSKKPYSSAVGKTLAVIKGKSVEYQMSGKELYVRATISSSKPHPNPSFENQVEQAWTQPVVWKR